MSGNNKNSQLITCLDKFSEEISKIESDDDVKLFHPKSVKNIAEALSRFHSKESEIFKDKLIEYFKKVDQEGYFISNKLESIELYNKFLSPTIRFLIKKNDFRIRGAIVKDVLIGVILDTILYFIIDRFMGGFIILFIVIAFVRHNKSKKSGKYAAMFW